MEEYDYILTTKSMIKFEKDLKVCKLGNDNYDIELGEHFKNNNIYKKKKLKYYCQRTTIMTMEYENTKNI